MIFVEFQVRYIFPQKNGILSTRWPRSCYALREQNLEARGLFLHLIVFFSAINTYTSMFEFSNKKIIKNKDYSETLQIFVAGFLLEEKLARPTWIKAEWLISGDASQPLRIEKIMIVQARNLDKDQSADWMNSECEMNSRLPRLERVTWSFVVKHSR